MPTTVTVYGDSILKSVLFEDGKYGINPEQERALSQRYSLTVRNLSRFGATLSSTLAGMERDLAAHPAPDYCVLEFGGNDCDYRWSDIAADPFGDHVCATPPEDFAFLYRKAIALVREAGSTPILVTLPPLMPERYLNHVCERDHLSRESVLRFLEEANTIYRWQEKYSGDAVRIARQENTELVDVRGKFLTRQHLGALICQDGIHPNRAGQRLVAEAFSDFIRQKRSSAQN